MSFFTPLLVRRIRTSTIGDLRTNPNMSSRTINMALLAEGICLGLVYYKHGPPVGGRVLVDTGSIDIAFLMEEPGTSRHRFQDIALLTEEAGTCRFWFFSHTRFTIPDQSLTRVRP